LWALTSGLVPLRSWKKVWRLVNHDQDQRPGARRGRGARRR
jgi:hypothetical protein